MTESTDPMPLDTLPSSRPEQGHGHGPLQWLRSRLFPDRRPSPGHDAPLSAAPASRGQALRKAHAALQQRFAMQPALSQVFPHLSLLERALARQGSQALRRIASPVLQHALAQLEELQFGAESADLGVLRNRMIEELALRSVRAGAEQQQQSPAPTFELPDATTSPEVPDTDIGWLPSSPTSRRH